MSTKESWSSKPLGTVVVTGGAGAIGSRLVRRLLLEGADSVVVVDDLSSGHQWLLPEYSRVELIVRDVCEILDVELDVSKPLIFHLAAFFANQNSVNHPVEDLHTNGLGTLTTLIWASERQARRFVYASAGCSIAKHGTSEPFKEDMPVSLHLDTPYQITKALGEFYCNYFDSRVPSVRCRFFNSYGPGELPGPYRNVVPNFIWRALNDEPLIITGTGNETRDFIYVDDLVEGLGRAAVVPAACGEAINLGTGQQTRILDLAETIIKMCNSKSPIEFAPRRPWDKSQHREANIEKAKDILGLSPTVSIYEGIGRTIEWFKENRTRIESVIKA
jgi:nucleoside-diphosphate-sugar epimerase